MFKLNHHNFISVKDFLDFLKENKSDNCDSKHYMPEYKKLSLLVKTNSTTIEKIESIKSGITPEKKFIETDEKEIIIFFDLATSYCSNSFEHRIESIIQLLLNIEKLEKRGKKIRLFFCLSGVNSRFDTVNLVSVMVKDFKEKVNVTDLSYTLSNVGNELFIEWADKAKIAEKMQGYGTPVGFRGPEIIKQILNCFSLPNAYYFSYNLIRIHHKRILTN
jgi:hypothetical protein